MEIQKSLRFRVNVSQTTTGKKSWDCTVDAEGFEMLEVLKLSDDLVESLQRRYPAPVEKEASNCKP